MTVPLLFIATPAYGGMVHASYVASLLPLYAELSKLTAAPIVSFIANESLISRARNRAVAEFLRSKCSHLVFIDGDIGFTAQSVFDLAASGLDVVGAAIPLKTPTPKFALTTRGETITTHKGKRYVECRDLGTGVLCVKRSTVERLIATYGSDARYLNTDTGEIEHDLFPVGVDRDAPQESRRYLSEDYGFCRLATKAGFKVLCALDGDYTHTGPHSWRGNAGALVNAGASLAPIERTKEQ